MASLRDFLAQHRAALQASLTDIDDATARFLDPDQHVPFAESFDQMPFGGPLAVALDACLQRVFDPKLSMTHVQRLGLATTLQRRAAFIASPPRGVALSPQVLEVLNVVMHDLRTPLVTIRGYAEMMLRGFLDPMTEKQTRTMRTVLRNSIALDDQIDTFLDYARLQQGRITIHPVPISLEKVLRHIQEGLDERAEQKGLTLTVDAPEKDLSLLGNVEKLRRVLRILLDNAVKFTEQGQVRLKVTQSGDRRAIFSVEDTGCGVDSTLHAQIFEPFFKASDEQGSKGIGLGLTVARDLIAAHGSRLEVESAAGRGARFSFSLALAP